MFLDGIVFDIVVLEHVVFVIVGGFRVVERGEKGSYFHGDGGQREDCFVYDGRGEADGIGCFEGREFGGYAG